MTYAKNISTPTKEASEEDWTRYDELISNLKSLSNSGEKEHAKAVEYVNTALLPK
jgi:hypothetical protein